MQIYLCALTRARVQKQRSAKHAIHIMAHTETPLDGLLTKQGLAEKLKCSKRTVDNLVAAKKIKAVKLGKLIRFDWDKVRESLTA